MSYIGIPISSVLCHSIRQVASYWSLPSKFSVIGDMANDRQLAITKDDNLLFTELASGRRNTGDPMRRHAGCQSPSAMRLVLWQCRRPIALPFLCIFIFVT